MTIVSFHSLCTQLQPLASFAEYGKRKNASTLVMHVPWCQPFSCDMIKRNSNVKFCFSFTHDVENGNSHSYFRFPRQIGTSIFVFRFSNTLYNRIAIVISVLHLLFSYGIEKRNLNFGFRLSFWCFIMLFQDSSLLSRGQRSFSLYIFFPPRLRSSKSTSQLTVCNGVRTQSCDYNKKEMCTSS